MKRGLYETAKTNREQQEGSSGFIAMGRSGDNLPELKEAQDSSNASAIKGSQSFRHGRRMTNEELLIKLGQKQIRIERLEKELEKLREMFATSDKANWCVCGALLMDSSDEYCCDDCEKGDLGEPVKFLHSGRV